MALEALRALFATDQSPLWRSQRPRVIRIGTRLGVGALEEAEADRRLEAFAGAIAKALLTGNRKPWPRAGMSRPGGAGHGANEAKRAFSF